MNDVQCYNANDSHWCKHHGFTQAGGGWSDRSFIYCDLLHRKIFLDPPIPKHHLGEPYKCLMPNDCPVVIGHRRVKNRLIQLRLFDEAAINPPNNPNPADGRL